MLNARTILLHTLLFTSILMLDSAGAATVAIPRTGQTACSDSNGVAIACAGTGQDGDTLKGAAWPTQRFTDNNNGTVSDNLTGMIWLKNPNCFGRQTWVTALNSANTLASGACGLTDGSVAGQWSLPNRRELASKVDRSKNNPALPAGHPFTPSVQFEYYWSSSSNSADPDRAWLVHMGEGNVNDNFKTFGAYVWPVRPGQ